jgi:uncharacterized protein
VLVASNVDTVNGVYEAIHRGDMRPVLELMVDDVEWREPESLPYGVHRGPRAVAEHVFRRVGEDFPGLKVTPQEVIDGGDVVVVLGRYEATARTGRPFSAPFVHVWRLRDGRISAFTTHTDTYQWLEALRDE